MGIGDWPTGLGSLPRAVRAHRVERLGVDLSLEIRNWFILAMRPMKQSRNMITREEEVIALRMLLVLGGSFRMNYRWVPQEQGYDHLYNHTTYLTSAPNAVHHRSTCSALTVVMFLLE